MVQEPQCIERPWTGCRGTFMPRPGPSSVLHPPWGHPRRGGGPTGRLHSVVPRAGVSDGSGDPSAGLGPHGGLLLLSGGPLAPFRTTNLLESPFAALRIRTDAAKRYKRLDRATALIWKLLMVAEKRFRRLRGRELPQRSITGASGLKP